ncbi:uncharacterized protein LOC143295981 [Babylonia areolata]|uniref:uncharacterized protein LOC143295981 n=1 Tax=Babylonia areolata TaxID=304850 RepID=UPI003FCEFE5B
MQTMKTATTATMTILLATMLLLHMPTRTTVTAASLGTYKSCLYACLNCVNTWGKDLFNGEKCADNCAMTEGRGIDTTCTSFFVRSSRRVSGARQYLHSEDITGRYRNRLAGGYTNGYLGYRSSYRNRKLGPSVMAFRSYPDGRSTLSRDCQQMCRTCEARFTSSMDAHSCLYTCVRTKKAVISC